MKHLVFLLTFFCISSLLYSQVYRVLQEHCKKKDIEIITGDKIPEGYAVLQSGDFDKEEIEGNLEGLTKKQIKKMKMYGKWRDCCKVFIAFNQIEEFEAGERYSEEKAKQYRELMESKVHFYVLAPIWEMQEKIED